MAVSKLPPFYWYKFGSNGVWAQGRGEDRVPWSIFNKTFRGHCVSFFWRITLLWSLNFDDSVPAGRASTFSCMDSRVKTSHFGGWFSEGRLLRRGRTVSSISILTAGNRECLILKNYYFAPAFTFRSNSVSDWIWRFVATFSSLQVFALFFYLQGAQTT